MCPEAVLLMPDCELKYDVWSLGCIFAELLAKLGSDQI